MLSKTSINNILFWIAILCAIWFAIFGLVWFYLMALVIAYPVGVVSLLIWFYIKRDQQPRNKAIPIILGVGLAMSLIALLCLFIITNI